MNKSILIIIIVLIIGIGGYFLFYGSRQNPPPSFNPPPAPQNQQPPTEDTVIIKNSAFNPSTLTVKAGTTVTWVNEDSTTHQIISDSEPAENYLPGLFSLEMTEGQNCKYTFKKVGTFGYHCNIHPEMKGTIVVEK